MDHESVVLYIPAGLELPRWWDILAGWTEQQGWRPDGLVRDWRELARLLGTGEHDLAVAATELHLPPRWQRRPTIVIADQHPAGRPSRWRR